MRSVPHDLVGHQLFFAERGHHDRLDGMQAVFGFVEHEGTFGLKDLFRHFLALDGGQAVQENGGRLSGLLHQGGVILSEDIEDMKLKMQKVQCVFDDEEAEKAAVEGLEILLHDKRGRLSTYTVRGEREEVEEAFKRGNPLFFEVLSLSLEEIFICETEVVGYDIRKFVLG